MGEHGLLALMERKHAWKNNYSGGPTANAPWSRSSIAI